MPRVNKYVVYNTRNKLYYNVSTIGGDCMVNINNATFFSYDEYLFRRRQDNYLRQDEKFIKIKEDGNKKLMR